MVDFYILEQFITFYHTGTLCDAAKKLHISQSTLTRSMQKLESKIAVPLFKRTKNSISFTETGQLAAEKVILFLKQYKTMLYKFAILTEKTILFLSVPALRFRLLNSSDKYRSPILTPLFLLN